MAKYKLSKKARTYLKAQAGAQVPYEFPYQDNTTPFDLGQIDPNLFQAQQNQIVKPPNLNQNQVQDKNVLTTIGNNIPFLGSALKLGTGIVSLFQAANERKRAKRREQNANKDLQRRMNETRENDFYYTGQTSGNYSDFNKKGGKVAQQGGFMDFYQSQEQLNKQTQNIWTDYYDQYVEDQKIKAQQLQQQGLSNTIGGGLGLASSILSGGMMKRGGILSKALKYQNGGLNLDTLKTPPMTQNNVRTPISNLTPEHFNLLNPDTTTNESIDAERASYVWNYKKENPEMFDMLMGLNSDRPHAVISKRFYKSDRMKQDGGGVETVINEDLYSPDFQSPVQNQNQDVQSYFTEVMNKYQALDPQGSLENKAMSWIFEEEEEPKRYNIGEVFNQNQNQKDKPILKVVEDFKSMGLNPSSVESGTHNVGSKHLLFRATDLGLNTTFKGNVNKMKQFKQWFETEGKNRYPGLKLIDETIRPAGQKEWSGAHYHLEY